MILRLASEQTRAGRQADPWQTFADSQDSSNTFSGCISQPAHAALAGRIAAALNPEPFGLLPKEAIETIGRHDAGWAEEDLAALEDSARVPPQSFLRCGAKDAVDVWRRSIRRAEAHSMLAGILTSRHFCLLSQNEGDPWHDAFREDETRLRMPRERDCGVSDEDLDRFTGALGFCDLLSLCLCSGLSRASRIPLAHPASSDARQSDRIDVVVKDGSVVFDRQIVRSGTRLFVNAWIDGTDGAMVSRRIEWIVT